VPTYIACGKIDSACAILTPYVLSHPVSCHTLHTCGPQLADIKPASNLRMFLESEVGGESSLSSMDVLPDSHPHVCLSSMDVLPDSHPHVCLSSM